MKMVGLIPARSGSKRLPGKNVKLLNGFPLLAYSIASALECPLIDKVLVSTDSKEYCDIARTYGSDALMRPEEYATDTSPDIEWVKHALNAKVGIFKKIGEEYDAFAILRPTSPFRSAAAIERAVMTLFNGNCDSVRAVKKVSQHPAKMWVVRNGYLHPLLPVITGTTGAPGHSSQLPSLPEVWVQSAALEVAWTKTVLEQGTIAGEVMRPLYMERNEDFDINSMYDFEIAEKMVRDGLAVLPGVKERYA